MLITYIGQVQPVWKGTGTNIKCRNLQTSRSFMGLLKDSSNTISKEYDNMIYMIEDLKSINVISVTVKVKPNAALLKGWKGGVTFTRVSTWASRVENTESGCKIISVEADCCQQLSYLHVTLPHFPSEYMLMLDQSGGQITDIASRNSDGEVDQNIVIRIPYRVEGGRFTSDQAEGSVEGEGSLLPQGSLQCSFCCNSLTAPGAITKAYMLPSGKFDHVSLAADCS